MSKAKFFPRKVLISTGELFKGSAVKRAKYKGLKRNINAIACINKEKKLTLYPKQQDYDKKSE